MGSRYLTGDYGMSLEQLLRAAGLDSRLEQGFQLRPVESHAVRPGLP